ncbi:hypothetical protein [Anaerophilus nitritogenes]|uniref:hypothetical protein n=1 Tax=Anaerophilus nitritogenes TaxID=2498136 RepID=UPI00101B76D5|nr:hypothetical protein [Anaerophilus nitritogenes]
MFVSKSPIFGRGRILKIEMLEHVRDFSKDMIKLHLHGYSNGILTGCRLLINDDYIIIQPGMIYFDEEIYILKENYTIPYVHTNETAILKVKFIGENSNKDFVSHGTQILIDSDIHIYEDEIELCRFKLKEGAKLRNNYVNFEDLITEYNTLNIIHTPFAAYRNSTLSPYVLNYFAKEAFQHKLSNPLDISFCMQCLKNEESMSKELILNYIAARLEIDYKDYSNEKLYKFLVEILHQIQSNKGNKRDRNYLSKKILVD